MKLRKPLIVSIHKVLEQLKLKILKLFWEHWDLNLQLKRYKSWLGFFNFIKRDIGKEDKNFDD